MKDPGSDRGSHLRTVGEIVGVLLDHAEAEDEGGVEGDERDIDQRLDSIVDARSLEIAPEDRRRLLEQGRICKEFFVTLRELDSARVAGDETRADQLMPVLDRLREQAAELAGFHGFTDAAERLCRAQDFAAFCAAVPAVALDRIYGGQFASKTPFPLIWAMTARDRPLVRVQLLLRAGARTDLTTPLGDTVLHAMACMKRRSKVRLAILRALVFRGADLNARNIWDRTPLSVALEQGSIEDVGHFLTVGARIGLEELQQAAPYPERMRLVLKHLAPSAETTGLIARLGPWLRLRETEARQDRDEALRSGKSVDWFTRRHRDLAASLAQVAARQEYSGSGQAVKVTWAEEPAAFSLIETATTLDDLRHALKGVMLASYPATEASQPVYWPIEAKSERPQRLWLMLSAGASVDGGPNGTALHILAAQRNRNAAEQANMVRMLVQRGAKLEALNHRRLTPLGVATVEGGLAEVQALLAAGANPDIWLRCVTCDGPRRLPLLFAAAEDARKFSRLIEAGARTDRCARDGTSLPDLLRRELAQEEADLKPEAMSRVMIRMAERRIRNLTKSIAMLERS